MGRVGDTLMVPVTVEEVTGLGVKAYGLTVTYDPAVVKVVAVVDTGSLSAEMTVQANLHASGRVTVSAAGATPLTGHWCGQLYPHDQLQ
jgi:hypothetical protein